MTAPEHQPNHFHWHRGDDGCHHGFGDFDSVRAVTPFGNGHDPFLEIRTKWGLKLNVSEEWLTALVRQAPAEIAKLHRPVAVHDAVAVDE